MSSARHRTVVPHAFRRRLVRLAVPAAAATALTAGVVGVAVGVSAPDQEQPAAGHRVAAPLRVDLERAAPAADLDSPYLAQRIGQFSRSAKRVTLQEKPEVRDRLWMTANLNLWPTPREKGKPLDVLEAGKQVSVTGVKRHGFAEILFAGQVRWVNRDYLAAKKPVPPKPEDAASSSSSSSSSGGGVTTAPCPDGSATESGLTSSAVRLYRSVCNAFPALSSYGGYDGHGEHSSGKAIDFMIEGDSSLGQAVADWARAHAAELDLYDVIWAQHIWTPVRASEGWRSMPDRGSATANHYDHVHISVN